MSTKSPIPTSGQFLERQANGELVARPFEMGCYTLYPTGLKVRGRPTFEEHEGVGAFIQWGRQGSPFWFADWLRYGDRRTDWKDKIEQAIKNTGRTEKTLKNIRAVGAVDFERRHQSLDIGYHEAVASMAGPDQTLWLEKAHDEGWNVRELRLEIRASRRRKILEGQAVLEGIYRVLLADCPWIYGDRPPSGSGAQQHYPGMTVDQLCKLPIAAHTYPDAVLFMWVTAPMLYYSSDGIAPDPFRVIKAWGFEAKTHQIWDKVLSAGGHYVAAKHELLLICTRGSCTPDRPVPMPDSVIVERRDSDFLHSQKPESFRKQIEQMYDGPYLELFARERRERWTTLGNDAALWSEDVAQQHEEGVATSHATTTMEQSRGSLETLPQESLGRPSATT